MKHQLYKYSTNQLMVSSFTGGPCAIRCPQLSRCSHVSIKLPLWLRNLCQTWTQDVFVPCWHIHHCYRNWWGSHCSGLRQPCTVFRPPPPHHLSWWLHKVGATSQGGVIRDLFSCPQRSKARLNKEPIHALCRFALLAHSLFKADFALCRNNKCACEAERAGIVLISVKSDMGEKSLHVGEKSCVSAHTPCLSRLMQAHMCTCVLAFLCDWHEHALMCCFHVCVKRHLLHKGLCCAYHGCRISCNMDAPICICHVSRCIPPLQLWRTNAHGLGTGGLFSHVSSIPCSHFLHLFQWIKYRQPQ